jgi:hypothetical protein
MQTPIFVAFYTVDTIYEQEAARLRCSLQRLGLDHYLEGVPDAGSWTANTHRTASFTLAMQEKFIGRPVVYLDADAFVWRTPELLLSLDPAQTDIAFHRRRGHELLNGTVWYANNDMSRALCRRHAELCAANPNFRDEQQFLWQAIVDLKPRWVNIPPALCWIHDIMAEDLGDADPIIEHLQCSRESSKSSLLPNRRARLAYLSSMGY